MISWSSLSKSIYVVIPDIVDDSVPIPTEIPVNPLPSPVTAVAASVPSIVTPVALVASLAVP